jgi:mannose-1-phosphate guanylyltransferase
MKAVILAGGLGTRLRPITDNLPKPVVPMGNRAFAEFQIDILRKVGIGEIVFSLGYQPERIRGILGNGERFGVRLEYVTEPEPLGTAGAFAFANRGADQPVVVLNGDILTDVDLTQMIEIHRSTSASATLFLTEVADPTKYGLVDVDQKGRITGFREKPSAEEAARIERPLINAGIYLLSPSTFDLIPSNTRCMFEHDVFPALIARGDMVSSFAPECYWRDIGTIENYLEGNIDSLKPPFREGSGSLIGEGCSIADTAVITDSVLADDIVVGGDSTIAESVIHRGTRIGDRCRVDRAVIGSECVIADDTDLDPGTVLADGTIL